MKTYLLTLRMIIEDGIFLGLLACYGRLARSFAFHQFLLIVSTKSLFTAGWAGVKQHGLDKSILHSIGDF